MLAKTICYKHPDIFTAILQICFTLQKYKNTLDFLHFVFAPDIRILDKLQTIDYANLKYKGGTLMEAYCMKCRAKREMRNPRAIKMKNGKPATQGVCAKCGTKMFRIGKA